MKRLFSILLAAVMLCAVMPFGALTVIAAEQVTYTVSRGETLVIECYGTNNIQGVHMTFNSDGNFIGKITGIDKSGSTVYEENICDGFSDSVMFVHSATYTIESYYGTMEVRCGAALNTLNARFETLQNGNIMAPLIKTNLDHIFLPVGETVKYNISWAPTGYFAEIADDIEEYFKLGGTQYYISKGYGSLSSSIASIEDGTITANAVGETTVALLVRFGVADDEWFYVYGKCTVTVIDDYSMSDHYEKYTMQIDDKYFNIIGEDQDGKRDVGFDIAVNNETINTGDDYQSIVSLTDEYDKNGVTISKDGYIDYTLEDKYLSDYNWVSMSRERTDGAPSVLAVLGHNSTDPEWHNLRVHTLNIFEETSDNYCIDVSLYENGNIIKSMWIQQGDVVIPVQNGTTGDLPLGTMLTSDGGEIRLNIETTKDEKLSVRLLINVFSPDKYAYLDFGEGIDATVTQKVDGLNGLNFNLKLGGNVPFEYKVDGDGKFKATIGVIGSSEKTATYYDAIKETVTRVNNSPVSGHDQRMDDLLKKMEKGGIEQRSANVSVGVECKAGFIGYAEGYRDAYGQMTITEVGIACTISMEYSVTRQSFASPYYWKISAGGEMMIPIISSGLNDKGNFDIKIPHVSIELKLGGQIMAGYAGLVGAGVKLTSQLEITGDIHAPLSETTWILNAKFAFAIDVLSASIDFSWWDDLENCVLYDGAGTAQSNTALAKLLTDETKYTQIPRYLSTRTESEEIITNDGTKVTTFSENVYSNSTPQIVSLGSDLLMVWLEDMPERTDENRTCLCYSIYDSETEQWSETQAVLNDGKADHNPILKESDGQIYLVWQKASCEYASGATLGEMAGALDIYFSVFDVESNTFGEPINVSGDNGLFDYSPCIVDDNGVITVLWVQNSENDIFGETGEFSIHSATITETGVESSIVLEQISNIYGITAKADNGSLILYYAMDTDSDYLTYDDIELFSYYVNNDITEQLTSNDAVDQLPFIHNDELYWYSDGVICCADARIKSDADDAKFVMLIDEKTGMQAVLYTVQNELDNNIYATFNDGSGWGDPIQITTFENTYVSSFDASFTDGKLAIVANCKAITEDSKFGSSSIKFIEKALNLDISVEHAEYTQYSLVEGGILEGTAVIKNNGTKTAHTVMVQVKDSNGEILAENGVEKTLRSGESVTATFYCNVDDIKEERVSIEVLCCDDEEDYRNNTMLLDIDKYDVAVDGTFAEKSGDMVHINTVVSNYGMGDLTNVNIYVCQGNRDGEVLYTQTITELKSLDRISISCEVDTLDVGDCIYVYAEGIENENIVANNEDFAVVSSVMMNTEIELGPFDTSDDVANLGDVNDDGAVDQFDYLLVKRAYFGTYTLDTDQEKRADVDESGFVDQFDYLLIKRAYFGTYTIE